MEQPTVPRRENKSERTHVKEEPGRDTSDEANAMLYAGHEVKQEIVLGPVLLQLPDVAYKFGGKSLSETKQDQKKTETVEPVKPVFVKPEPNWTTDESDDDTDTLLADFKVKEELLENDLHHVRAENIKQEREDKSDDLKKITMKQEQVDRTKEMKASNKRLKKTENQLKNTKKSKIKPDQMVRISSRLRIQFEEEPYYLDNQLEHKKIAKHECNKCYKEFRSKAILKTHMRSHTGEKPYSCPLCLKKFSDFAVLCRHRRIHTGQKPHKCDVCNKSFSEKYLLKNHKRIHTGEKVYFCENCPKTFTNSSNYRRHVRIHTKKYCCDICGRYFEKKSNLIKHINDHVKPRPHVCEICQKRFLCKGHLNRHIATHIGAKTVYACGVCQAKFTQHMSLKRHMARKVCMKKNTVKNR